MVSAIRLIIGWVALLVCIGPDNVIAGAHGDFLRGYAQAVVDTQFPQIGVRVTQVSDDGRARLTAGQCIEASDREAVATALRASEKIVHINWSAIARCEPAAVAEAAQEETAETSGLYIEALPVDELFKPLIADPRQPQFSVKWHVYESAADTFNAASASFGDYFPFVTGIFGESGSSQIGLQGAVFAVFNLDSESFDLVNADYWIGLPVSYRKGPWSFLARLYHQSSHLGDEFLLGNPGINRINLSYEDLEALASYDWENLRIYWGGGSILHSEPDLDPWHLQAGVEYRRPNVLGELDLVAAVDWQADQESDWARNRSYQLGFTFSSTQGREVRLMLEHFRGHSPNGQFYREHLRYTGLGLYFDF